MAIAVGSTFAGHEILGVAGRGGMGVVYRARQISLDRIVALKVVEPSLASDESFQRRFLQESRLAASIDHPNVIPVYYAEEEDGVPYVAMRFVDGHDLRELVAAGGPLPAARAVEIVAQVAAALDAAHAAGLVHRDVKPANVLLTRDDHVYLTDFGLTKRSDTQGGHTVSGQWVGTLSYMAPEQIRGTGAGPASDTYALGCVLFQCLTGRTPFPREGDEAIMWAHLHEPPPAPSALVPGLAAALDAVIARALAKDPAERFPSAGALGAAAQRALTGAVAVVEPTLVSPREEPTRIAAAARRRWPRAALALALLAVVVVVTVVALSGGGAKRDRAATDRGTPAAPTRLAAVTQVRGALGSRPNAIATTAGAVWVTSFRSGTLSRVDPRSATRVGRPLRIGRGPSAIASGYGALWVTNAVSRTVTKVSASSGRRVASAPTPTGVPVAVVAARGAVWVLTTRGDGPMGLLRLRPGDLRLEASLVLPHGRLGWLAYGMGALWVSNSSLGAVLRIDPAHGTVARTYRLGAHPTSVTVGPRWVWAVDTQEDQVDQIEPTSGRVVTILTASSPRQLVDGPLGVWVTLYGSHAIARVDPRAGTLVGTPLTVGHNPFAIAAGPGVLWVSAVGDDAVVRVGPR
jgi:streptogramin lyase/predicted Ser/Thr protein kinase